MNWKYFLVAAGVLLSGLGAVCAATPPELTRADLPRTPPVEVTNVFATFHLKPGFQMQVAACEPNVMDPIEICFDENGRLFVVEMRDYSEMRDVTPHLGRIRMLEDTNEDGVYDKATVYADDLPWPTGVFYYDGGVFVAATPDILYFKDTDGDGRADSRKVVFTGYGVGMERLNVQGLVNSLRWGLDNRIHGQTSSDGGRVRPANAPASAAEELRGRDFNFDPRTLDLQLEAGGGQYGMSFDNYGRKFACSNSRHLMAFMYDSRYADRNPWYHLPSPLVDIPVDGPAAEVFRTSPEEKWRIIRTHWRVAGLTPGPIEGGGRASGYFTGATGATIYRGDAWPEDYLGDAFTADIGSNLIHRKKVRTRGVELIAERPADEQKVEFLTSTDLWFRPAQMANAPDGCLYVCDMYREFIEHPWSLPESIKKFLDLNAGNDRGRIYRIAPDGFKPRPLPKLGRASTKELVATLAHKNGWHRDTAARLLYERHDLSAVPWLEQLLTQSPSALARMHALHVLDGLGALKSGQLEIALRDADPHVREHAVKLTERILPHSASAKAGGGASGEPPANLQLWSTLRGLADDPDAWVRYQVAFTLGEFNRPGKIAGLATIARRDLESSWTRAAILSSLSAGAGEMFTALAADARVRESSAGRDFLEQLVLLVGAQHRPDEVAGVVKYIGQLDDAALAISMTRALGDGLQRAHQSLDSLGAGSKRIFARAAELAADANAPESQRVAAIQLLALTSYADSGGALLRLLDQPQPQAVQLAALSTLARFTDPQLGGALTQRWNELSPRLRAETLTVLLARADRATALLRAIEAGGIRANALNSTQAELLRKHKDQAVSELAAKVLAAATTSTRQQVVDAFRPALNLPGDSAHGKKIYEERCLSCHRLGGEGYALGPDLISVKTAGNDKTLLNILDPNAEVRPEFTGYVVDTKDENTFVGLLVNETARSVTVRQAYGKEDVIPRGNISSLRSQGLSLMPEGLESGLTPQDMADLLECIATATK